jgi:hypothetical protein
MAVSAQEEPLFFTQTNDAFCEEILPLVKNAKLELPVDSCDPASPQQFNFQESHWGEDDHGYPYAHQYSNERSTYIYDVNNDDWYNQYHYPQQKLEGYWPSYNYEADLQSSSQQESSQYEEYETNKEDSLIEEDEDLQCIAKGKAIQERIAAREKAAKTQASSSNTDEDWTSLSATFDRATSKPGAFQGIVNRLDENAVLEQPVVRRTVDVAADKGRWEEFLAGAALQSATPASSRVRERNSSPQHIRENSPGKGARPPSPTEVAEPNQDRDMRAQESSSAAAEDLSKSDGESESASEEFDENVFMENLDKLAASGELDTVEGVKQAFINAFGEEMIVSGELRRQARRNDVSSKELRQGRNGIPS